jgi:hypothetical protein
MRWAELTDSRQPLPLPSAVTSKQLLRVASFVESAHTSEDGRFTKTREGDNILGDMLGDGSEQSRYTLLGNILQRNRDGVFGEWRIKDAGRDARTKSQLWSLEAAKPADRAEPRGTSRNLADKGSADFSDFSPEVETQFAEPSEPSEPFSGSHARESGYPVDTCTHTYDTHIHLWDSQKGSEGSEGSAGISQNHRAHVVDSAAGYAEPRGTFGDKVPRNGFEVPRDDFDAAAGL